MKHRALVRVLRSQDQGDDQHGICPSHSTRDFSYRTGII